jgi:hypothetical protein
MANLYEIRQRAKQAQGMQPSSTAPEAQQAEPFTGGNAGGGRDYRAIYRAIYAYHEQYNPPRLTDEYWQSAVEGVKTVAVTFDNDPFITALLMAVYGEMEREYNRLKAAQPGEHEPQAVYAR